MQLHIRTLYQYSLGHTIPQDQLLYSCFSTLLNKHKQRIQNIRVQRCVCIHVEQSKSNLVQNMCHVSDSKHTNAWRLTLAYYSVVIALCPLLQTINKAETPLYMKITINISPVFCIRVGKWCLCMIHVPCQRRLKADNNQYAEDCSDLSKAHWFCHNPLKSYRYSCKV